MKKAICVQSSKEFFPQTIHAIESAKKNNPDYKIILLSDGIETNLADYLVLPEDLEIDRTIINPTTGHPLWLVTGRTGVVKYTLEKLNFDFCVFIDGDTYTYNSYDAVEYAFNDGASVIVTPHLLNPIPNDNLFPSIQYITLYGNYNSGFFAVSKKGLNFLTWWDEQTRTLPYLKLEVGLAAEQGWLRFAADFDDNTKILRNKGYNVAYWNINERDISIKNNILYAGEDKLTIMHFSGFKSNTSPEKMMAHQNRLSYNKDTLIYKIYNDYKKLVWG